MRRIARDGVLRIERVTLAHLDSETACKRPGRAAERSVIRDQQQCTAAFYPILYSLDLFVSERGFVSAFVVIFFGAESVGDHEDLGAVERGPAERLATANHAIAVVREQIDEWFVATVAGVEVVMCFIKQHPRALAFVRGIVY